MNLYYKLNFVKICMIIIDLYDNNLKKQLYFYEFYDEFNSINNYDLFNLDYNIEWKKYVPIVIKPLT